MRNIIKPATDRTLGQNTKFRHPTSFNITREGGGGGTTRNCGVMSRA